MIYLFFDFLLFYLRFLWQYSIAELHWHISFIICIITILCKCVIRLTPFCSAPRISSGSWKELLETFSWNVYNNQYFSQHRSNESHYKLFSECVNHSDAYSSKIVEISLVFWYGLLNCMSSGDWTPDRSFPVPVTLWSR